MDKMDKIDKIKTLFENIDSIEYTKLFTESEFRERRKFLKENQFPVEIARLPQEELNIKDAPLNSQLRMTMPKSIDLRSKFPDCYEQGKLGSCVANALVAGYQYITPSFFGSRLFLYYNQRVLGGNVKFDTGAYIHHGVLSLRQTGVCDESIWPYVIPKFTQKPPDNAYKSALKHKVLKAFTVTQTVSAMKAILVAGFPFVIGIAVYSSFQSSAVMTNGLVPMAPVNNKDKMLGGHCCICIGFDDQVTCPGSPPGSWLVRNSWGTKWALKGYFWLPYNYLTNRKLSSDNWYLSSNTN